MNLRTVVLLPLVIVCTALSLRAGDTVHERSWLGSEFALAKKTRFFQSRDTVNAFPASLREEQKAGIFVRSVVPNSPSSRAGLRAGDLILKMDGAPTDSLGRFYDRIDGMDPGDAASFTIWRRGETKLVEMVAGRETYRKVGTIGFGFFFSSRLDPWPNPDFSLFVVGYRSEREQTQLHSPESEYVRAVRAADGMEENEGRNSPEGWKWWLTPFNLGFHRRVLTQEAISATMP